MLYKLVKLLARLQLPLYAREIRINRPELLQLKGPVLLACNHPNSFLDSVFIDTLFEQPVWSLARGDAFKKSGVRSILHALKIYPVYRTSEGAENLHINYQTFEACRLIFKKSGIVTIFSEGKCINEWRLRPLKKGTARLAMQAWSDGIPLRVLPVALNYSSYHRYGKNLIIHFGDFIESSDIDWNESEGKRHQSFNERLERSLRTGVIELHRSDLAGRKQAFSVPYSSAWKSITALPALIGWILHAPLYFPMRAIVAIASRYNDHFDSIIAGLLLLLYPIYWTGLLFTGYSLAGWYGLSIALLSPMWIRALLAWLPQTD